MAIITAIDPGRVSGVCVFDTDTHIVLDAYTYNWRASEDMIKASVRCSEAAYVEVPILRSKGPETFDRVLKLAIYAGRWLGVLDLIDLTPQEIYPHTWKGSVKKEIMIERIKSKIPSLQEFLDKERATTKHEHMIDAAGLAYWASCMDYNK